MILSFQLTVVKEYHGKPKVHYLMLRMACDLDVMCCLLLKRVDVK